MAQNESVQNLKISACAIIGCVLGGIALLLSAVPIVNNFAFVLGLIGLILGVIGLVGTIRKKRGGKVLAIVTVVISALSLVIVLASQSFYGSVLDDAGKQMNDSLDRSTGKKTDEILNIDVTVDLGQLSAQSDEYGIVTTSLPVKVTNKLDEKKSYSIHLEIVDANGGRVVEDYVSANDLGPKQTQDFTAFSYIDSAKLDQAKAGTVKIVDVSQF